MTTKKIVRSEIVIALTKRDGYICQYPGCTKPFVKNDKKYMPTIDHWYPQAYGGTWDLDNLKLMHKECNTKKGDKIPNEDGSIPEPEKREPTSRAVRRAERPVVCVACNSGRRLEPDEECAKCGSGPMPPTHPMWAKLKPNECPHEGIWWCPWCMSGIIQRVPASKYVFDGGEPGID
jgi:hypothetical protein